MPRFKINYINTNFNKMTSDTITADNKQKASELAYQSEQWASGCYNAVSIKPVDESPPEEDHKIDLIPVPSPSQQHDYLYQMKLNYKISFELAEINDIAKLCGFQEEAYIKDAQIYSLTMTMPFIPDTKDIQEYGDIIKDTYNKSNDKLKIKDAAFAGYEYLYCMKNPNIPDIGQDIWTWVKQRDTYDDRSYWVMTSVKYKASMRSKLNSKYFLTRAECEAHRPK